MANVRVTGRAYHKYKLEERKTLADIQNTRYVFSRRMSHKQNSGRIQSRIKGRKKVKKRGRMGEEGERGTGGVGEGRRGSRRGGIVKGKRNRRRNFRRRRSKKELDENNKKEAEEEPGRWKKCWRRRTSWRKREGQVSKIVNKDPCRSHGLLLWKCKTDGSESFI